MLRSRLAVLSVMHISCVKGWRPQGFLQPAVNIDVYNIDDPKVAAGDLLLPHCRYVNDLVALQLNLDVWSSETQYSLNKLLSNSKIV